VCGFERGCAIKIENDVGISELIAFLHKILSFSRRTPQRRRSLLTGSIKSSGEPAKGWYFSEKINFRLNASSSGGRVCRRQHVREAEAHKADVFVVKAAHAGV